MQSVWMDFRLEVVTFFPSSFSLIWRCSSFSFKAFSFMAPEGSLDTAHLSADFLFSLFPTQQNCQSVSVLSSLFQLLVKGIVQIFLWSSGQKRCFIVSKMESEYCEEAPGFIKVYSFIKNMLRSLLHWTTCWITKQTGCCFYQYANLGVCHDCSRKETTRPVKVLWNWQLVSVPHSADLQQTDEQHLICRLTQPEPTYAATRLRRPQWRWRCWTSANRASCPLEMNIFS